MPNANVGRRILDEYDEYKYQVKVPMQDLETGADIPLMVEDSTYQLQINPYYISGILSDYTTELMDIFLSKKPNGVDSIMDEHNRIVDTYLPEYTKAKPNGNDLLLLNIDENYYLNPTYLTTIPVDSFKPDGEHNLVKRLVTQSGTKYVIDSIYLPDMDYVPLVPEVNNPFFIEVGGRKIINQYYIKNIPYVETKPDGTNSFFNSGYKINDKYLPDMNYVPTTPNSSKGSLIDSSTGLINNNYLPSSATGEYVPLKPDGTTALVNGSNKINTKYLPDMDYVPSSPDETHPLINGSGYLNTTTYLPNDFINSTGDNSLTIDKSAGKYNISHTNSATGVHTTKKFGFLGNNGITSFDTSDPQTNVSNDITTIGPETEFRIPYFTYNSKGHIVNTIDKRFRFSTTSVTGEDVRVKRLYPTDSGLVIDFNELVGLDEDTPITYYVYSATGVREVPYVYTNTEIRHGIYTSNNNLSNMNEYNVNLEQYSFILTVDRLGTNGVRSNLNQIVQTLEVLFYNTSGTLEGTIKRYRRTRIGGYWNDWTEIDYVEDAWETDNEGVGLTNPVSYGAVDTRFRTVENNMNGVMGQLTSINNFISDLTIDPETGSSSVLQTNVVQYYDITGDVNYVRGGALDLNSLTISNLENKCIRKIYYHGYFNNPSVAYTNLPDDYPANSTGSTEYSIVVVVDKIWESVVSAYPVVRQTLYITKRAQYDSSTGVERYDNCHQYQRSTYIFNNSTNGYSFESWKQIATTNDISNLDTEIITRHYDEKVLNKPFDGGTASNNKYPVSFCPDYVGQLGTRVPSSNKYTENITYNPYTHCFELANLTKDLDGDDIEEGYGTIKATNFESWEGGKYHTTCTKLESMVPYIYNTTIAADNIKMTKKNGSSNENSDYVEINNSRIRIQDSGDTNNFIEMASNHILAKRTVGSTTKTATFTAEDGASIAKKALTADSATNATNATNADTATNANSVKTNDWTASSSNKYRVALGPTATVTNTYKTLGLSDNFTYSPDKNLISASASGVQVSYTQGSTAQGSSGNNYFYPMTFISDDVGDLSETPTATTYGALKRDNNLLYNPSSGVLKSTKLQTNEISPISGGTLSITGDLTGNVTGKADYADYVRIGNDSIPSSTSNNYPIMFKPISTTTIDNKIYGTTIPYSTDLTYNPALCNLQTNMYLRFTNKGTASTSNIAEIVEFDLTSAKIKVTGGQNQGRCSTSITKDGVSKVQLFTTESTEKGSFNNIDLSSISDNRLRFPIKMSNDSFKMASTSVVEDQLMRDNFRKITYGNTEIEKDSELATGTIYLQYEN